MNTSVYRFSGFIVDATRRTLTADGRTVELTAKAFDTLLYLVENRGVTVLKGDLMDAVWQDVAVEENNLTQQISALRRLLGERPNEHRFIVTVPGKGYCFVAQLDETAKPDRSWHQYTDADARRGYAVAVAYVLVVASSFFFSGHQKVERTQSLAVLNFSTSTSGDEFIGTGITDTLRARLGSVDDLAVNPMSANGQDDVVATGRDLGVETVITGSVQRDHEHIRVAVQLVDVAAGRIVWGRTFDQDRANVFALQDKIAAEIARALDVNIGHLRTGPSSMFRT